MLPSSMPSLSGFQFFRDEMSFFKFMGCMLVFYYCIMDIFLYVAFMNTNLVESSKGAADDELYTPFTYVLFDILLLFNSKIVQVYLCVVLYIYILCIYLCVCSAVHIYFITNAYNRKIALNISQCSYFAISTNIFSSTCLCHHGI